MGVPLQRAAGQGGVPDQAAPAHARPTRSAGRGAAADALTGQIMDSLLGVLGSMVHYLWQDDLVAFLQIYL